MTPAKAARDAGLKSLAEAVEISHKPRRTLEDCFYKNRKHFDVIIAGCVAVKNGREAS